MRRLLLIALIAFAALAAEARACSCVGAAGGFPRAEGAFVGTIEARYVDGGRVSYVFAVEKVYRGSYPRQVSLPSMLSEASCGMDEEPGFRTGIVIFGAESHVGICNLLSEEELDELATPSPPSGPAAGSEPAAFLGALLGTCWSVFGS